MDNRASPIRRRRTAAVLCATLVAACLPAGPDDGSAGSTPSTGPDTARSLQGRAFERNVVFLTTRADSVVVVPWLVTAVTRPGGVDRRARGFLARNGTWEAFFQSSWETPPTRVPWRIVPHEGMRLIVGDEENLDRVVFEEGARQLQVVLGDALVEWSGQRGETFRLVEGALILSNQRLPGIVLDMARARRSEDNPLGDWAVLTSGAGFQAVLYSPEARAPGAAGAWRGWVRVEGDDDHQWPAVTLTWERARPFERARRDVPVSWSLTSPDGDLTGTLEVLGAWTDVGAGEGPQLPVDALFEVAGTLTLDGEEHPVRGLVRHEQR